MGNSVEFVLERSQATIDAATEIQLDWVWSEKTIVQLQTLHNALDAKRIATADKKGLFDVASAAEDGAHTSHHAKAVLVLGFLRTKIRNSTSNARLVRPLHARGDSRANIVNEGEAIRRVANEIDPAWEPEPGYTLGDFGDEITGCIETTKDAKMKRVTWRDFAEKLEELSDAHHDLLQAWYADATVKFPEGSAHGDMIRSTVPTTTVPPNPVGQAFIDSINLMAGGHADLHFHATHATHYKILRQKQGEPAPAIIAADVEAETYDDSGLTPGVYTWWVIGFNSGGDGELSAGVQRTVT